MSTPFSMPPTGFGPGSQPGDQGDDALDYMSMPQDMRTYSPSLPDVDELEGADLTPAFELLEAVAAACTRVAAGGRSERFDLRALDRTNRSLIAETMGSGEVAAKVRGIPSIAVQESVFAGIWMLQSAEADAIEVAAIPDCVTEDAFAVTRPAKGKAALAQPGVANAPAIMVELEDKSRNFDAKMPLHVVNLSLLPHTEQDLVVLDQGFGEGAVTILSRGYGNCRITATALPHLWRVQFFNSQDVLILDTFEVTTIPEVACAATEDLAESGDRLLKVLEAIQ